MKPIEPEAPTSKNPTSAELKKYHRELKQYSVRLQRWERMLAQHEDYLAYLEAELLAQYSDCDEEDGDCTCCGWQAMEEEDACCGWQAMEEEDDEDLDTIRQRVVASVMGGERQSAVLNVPQGDEVNFLEKLYSLSDARRPRRKKQ